MLHLHMLYFAVLSLIRKKMWSVKYYTIYKTKLIFIWEAFRNYAVFISTCIYLSFYNSTIYHVKFTEDFLTFPNTSYNIYKLP